MVDTNKSMESSPARSSSEVLCSSLSQGLHAAAQPLAILQASLGDDQTARMGVHELRELAVTCATEVERVCGLFSILKQLVSVEGTKPHVLAMSIQPLLWDVVDGVNLLFVSNRMLLSSIVPESCEPVLIDKARTLQALSIVLLTMQRLSRAQETVELIATSTSSNTVRVLVRNLKSSFETMSAETKLNMALAEANIRSQQASFSWSLQPFNVQIEFQRAPTMHSC